MLRDPLVGGSNGLFVGSFDLVSGLGGHDTGHEEGFFGDVFGVTHVLEGLSMLLVDHARNRGLVVFGLRWILDANFLLFLFFLLLLLLFLLLWITLLLDIHRIFIFRL